MGADSGLDLPRSLSEENAGDPVMARDRFENDLSRESLRQVEMMLLCEIELIWITIQFDSIQLSVRRCTARRVVAAI